ncbi:Potassium channel subfamily K member [Nesidiocoris tenuis]|uniref:Potassium channel subfamily K member n=1 Tax=Nesidiocoris tenuis TaxID=355587 RepID=A0ABN7B3A4_9HEMI|nr:Potassium channel subfamily K member [Nesidiocoris tenuis]
MFVQITNSRSTSKVGAVKSPSPERSFVQGRKFDVTETNVDESVVELSANSESVIAAQPMSGFDEQKSAKSKSERMLEKLGEKASKFRPKKFFGGEKEPEQPGIYTIDREMGRTNRAFDHDEGRSSPGIQSPVRGYISPARRISQTAELEVVMRQSELTDRLKRTRQNSPSSPVNSAAKGVSVQVSDYPPYRLLFIPPDDWQDPDSPAASLVKVMMCQCTVACFLLLWIVFGALVFYLTEGPYECDQIENFRMREKNLIFTLATDLRLVSPENKTDWMDTISKYTRMTSVNVREALVNTYDNQLPFWTFPGSLMFCVSLLTTLGLATPGPASIGGQVGAFVFALLGFPLHVFFLLNLGRTIAVRTQILAKRCENKFFELQERVTNLRRFGEDLPRESSSEIWPEKMFLVDFQPPKWLCFFVPISSFIYYMIGFLLFGVGRGMSFPRIVLFFADFSSTTGSTNGMTRMGYAWYLEGAAILTAVNSVLYADTPFEGLTPLGIKFGFMTNSLD